MADHGRPYNRSSSLWNAPVQSVAVKAAAVEDGTIGTVVGAGVSPVACAEISRTASARRTYGGESKLATGLRLSKAISFRPARSMPLGIVKGTVVQAAFAPFPIPSQFTNGLGPV